MKLLLSGRGPPIQTAPGLGSKANQGDYSRTFIGTRPQGRNSQSVPIASNLGAGRLLAPRCSVARVYRVQDKTVTVELIGQKKGNVLLIEGKEFSYENRKSP
jgi:hypothetical protein